MEQWTDQQAGMAAVYVILGIGLGLIAILAIILTYASTLGYHLYLP